MPRFCLYLNPGSIDVFDIVECLVFLYGRGRAVTAAADGHNYAHLYGSGRTAYSI